MSNLIDDVIRDFGKTIGLPDLTFNKEAVVHLLIDRVGELSLEREPNSLLAYLLRDYDNLDGVLCRKALSYCRFQEQLGFPVQCGLIGDNRLLFAIRIDEHELDLPRLTQALNLLESLHNRLVIN